MQDISNSWKIVEIRDCKEFLLSIIQEVAQAHVCPSIMFCFKDVLATWLYSFYRNNCILFEYVSGRTHNFYIVHVTFGCKEAMKTFL